MYKKTLINHNQVPGKCKMDRILIDNKLKINLFISKIRQF